MFRFNEADHSYWLNGERIPSVTGILREWKKRGNVYVNLFTGEMIDASIFEAAGDFGTAVHKGCKIIIEHGWIDEETIDPALLPPLKEFKRFSEDHGLKVRLCERPMYDSKKEVAGTPDIIGTIKTCKHLALIDIKTGGMLMVGPQTAKYQEIFKSYCQYRGIVQRYCLYLPRDGSPYRFTPLTNPYDIQFFNARYAQWKYLGTMNEIGEVAA